MTKEIKSFRDLEVWKKARILAKDVYFLSRKFPKEELYGITSQVRKSAVSVPSNIAEGHTRRSTKDFINFLSIALGSLAEVETQLIICFDIELCKKEDLKEIFLNIREIEKMLNTLRKVLKTKI